MRITRSTLRRIIGEESARILAESKKGTHERVPGGHQMRMAAGFEDEPAEVDFEDEDEDPNYFSDEFEDPADDPNYFPTDYGDEDLEDEDPNYFSDEYEDPADDPNYFPTDYEDLDEGEGKKRHMSPRDRLAAYLDRVGADVDAVMAAVDDAVSRGNEEGAEVSSEDVTFNLSDEVLDAIPEDDSDRWHSMLDAVLADEVDLDAFADAEADRQDVEDTERDLSHPSRFLEEGEGSDYDYEAEPKAEMGDPEDPYGDLPKGERPRGGLVHTAGFKGDSPAKALLRRREEFPEHPSGLTGMGGPYSEYDHLHYGAGINEARWAKLAGVLKD